MLTFLSHLNRSVNLSLKKKFKSQVARSESQEKLRQRQSPYKSHEPKINTKPKNSIGDYYTKPKISTKPTQKVMELELLSQSNMIILKQGLRGIRLEENEQGVTSILRVLDKRRQDLSCLAGTKNH